eukprot:1372617-Alexandrium_andersonii.AAC.1
MRSGSLAVDDNQEVTRDIIDVRQEVLAVAQDVSRGVGSGDFAIQPGRAREPLRWPRAFPVSDICPARLTTWRGTLRRC